jgi:hypothetical protein
VLSALLKPDLLNEHKFDAAVRGITASIKRSDIEHPDSLTLGVNRAEFEVYRNLYPDGSPERILADLNERDYSAVRFDDFVAWYDRFLERAKDTTDASGGRVDKLQATQRACSPQGGGAIRHLDINSGGWGHKAVVLIDRVYTADGPAGISNTEVRSLCHPQTEGNSVSFLPARLNGAIACGRRFFGEDRWLIVYSIERPVATASEMTTIAEGISRALGKESCSKIFVAKFTKQD